MKEVIFPILMHLKLQGLSVDYVGMIIVSNHLALLLNSTLTKAVVG